VNAALILTPVIAGLCPVSARDSVEVSK